LINSECSELPQNPIIAGTVFQDRAFIGISVVLDDYWVATSKAHNKALKMNGSAW